jgi:hypothetical protein
VLRGKDEIRAAWESQVEALDIRVEIVELTPLDETRVMAVGARRGRGSGSGALIERAAIQVFALEDRQVRSVETYANIHTEQIITAFAQGNDPS